MRIPIRVFEEVFESKETTRKKQEQLYSKFENTLDYIDYDLTKIALASEGRDSRALGADPIVSFSDVYLESFYENYTGILPVNSDLNIYISDFPCFREYCIYPGLRSIDNVHRKGKLHFAIQIWLFRMKDGEPQVLLKKRSAFEPFFPYDYDCALHQHYPYTKYWSHFLFHRLWYELGVKVDTLYYSGTSTLTFTEMWGELPWKENEVLVSYAGVCDLDENQFRVHPLYGSEVKWVNVSQIYDLKIRKDSQICFKLIEMENALERIKAVLESND